MQRDKALPKARVVQPNDSDSDRFADQLCGLTLGILITNSSSRIRPESGGIRHRLNTLNL
jgi:hypothetical protein